jgi:hypothetical protein
MPTINQMRQMLMQHAMRRMADGGQSDDADKVDENPDSKRVAESKAMLNPKIQTVRNPQRMAFPGIYKNPKEIAAEAAARVEPEDPSLKRLFGVSRGDLYEMGKGRKGNLPGTLLAWMYSGTLGVFMVILSRSRYLAMGPACAVLW